MYKNTQIYPEHNTTYLNNVFKYYSDTFISINISDFFMYPARNTVFTFLV